MQNVLLTISVIMAVALSTTAQTWHTLMANPELDYDSVASIMNTYFTEPPDSSILEAPESGGTGPASWESEATHYSRWQWFWETRLGVVDSQPRQFQPLAEAIFDWVDNYPTMNCASDIFQADWQCIGPFEHEHQRMGRIEAIWVDPADQNNILAASNSGGLWRYNAAGPVNWECITDGSGIPALGINKILVDQSGAEDHIICGTGFNAQGANYYGVGIIESTDGGDTWSIDEGFRDVLVSTGIGKRFRQYYPTVEDVEFLPGSNQLIATCRNHILIKDANGNWSRVYSHYDIDGNGDTNRLVVRLHDIEIVPGTNGQTILIGSADENGNGGGAVLLKSTNGGQNWNRVILPSSASEMLGSNRDFEFQYGTTPPTPPYFVNWFEDPNWGTSGWEHWQSSTIGGNRVASIAPLNNGNNAKLIRGFNKAILHGVEYLLEFDYDIPVDCRLEIYLTKKDNQGHYTHTYYDELASGNGRAEIVLKHFDGNVNTGYYFFSLQPVYDGSQAQSPDNVWVDNFSLKSNVAQLISIETPGSENWFVAQSMVGSGSGIIEYNDFGNGYKWDVIATNVGIGKFARYAVNTSNPDIMYLGNVYITKSTNRGNNFTSIHPSGNKSVHVDIRHLSVYAASTDGLSDKIYMGTDGGVSYSAHGGAVNQWIDMNGNGLAISQFYGFANHEQDASKILGGTQDNGTVITYDKLEWDIKTESDAYEGVMKRSDNSIWFMEKGPGWDRSNLYRTDLPGERDPPNISNENIPDFSLNVKPIDYHLQLQDKLFIGYHRFFRSNDDAETPAGWVELNADKSKPLKTFALDTYNPDADKYYVGYKRRSDNGVLLLGEGFPNPDWSNGDRSSGLPTKWYPITGIATDPYNFDRVWVSFGDISYNEHPDGGFRGRVSYSATGGANGDWTDMSQGLPQFPVNKIIYLENSDDILFAATDVGVYIWNKNAGTNGMWECFNQGMPTALITDLEVNYCTGTLRAATYGRGIWETPLPNLDLQVKEVTTNTVWNLKMNFPTDLIIKSGQTLTLGSDAVLNMAPGTRIIVERGGKLIVDGATLTNTCGNFWTGIEVHGHADQPHYSHYATQIALGTYPVDSNDHGVVVIKNGGTIENAHVGITNVKKNNGAILTHSGGIIIAEEANFINCWKGVEMYQFRPDKAGSASNPKQNISRFTNCTFKTTSDYFHDDYPPTDFVTLWDVHDVQFSGCTFENEAYADFLVDDRGNGITSIDATYQLKGRCTAFDTDGKCTTYQRNSFSHLTEGISYTASLGQPFITWIDRTDFTGNAIGVQAKGTHHDFRVTRSHFTLPTSASVNNRRCAGIELLGSTGFTVEDNTFEQSATFTGSESSAGIRIGVSGQKANRIYRNTFTNITNGIWADDDNRGLQIKCNTFTTGTIHKHDVIVCGNSTRDGIAKLQGECRQDISDFDYFSAPAGNLFSQSQGVQYSDWYNATALPTTKYHHHFTSTSNDPLELVYKNNATNEECVAEYDATKACPLNPILDDGKGPNQQISELRTRMADIHTELDGAPGGDYEKYLNTERELALSEGYKLYLTHDSLYGLDSARYWLEQDTSDLAKALLVALYVQEGDYTLADQALDSITDLAYTENTGKSYLDKLITIKSTDWHYSSTDSTTLAQVAALANDSTTYGWQAYGMLASAGYLEYPVPEPPCGPGAVIGSGKRAMDTLTEAPAAKTFLTLQPNPTSGGVTLTWDSEGEQIDLRVLTPQGKVVYQAQSWPGSGTRQIATPWPSGMYFIVLTDDQGKQHSTSLLLTK